MEKFKYLLDNPKNNLLLDIHSCGVDCFSTKSYEDHFTTVPRGIYVVLITKFGYKSHPCLTDPHIERKMYSNPKWPWVGDQDVINSAQIYFPSDRIFNPDLVFGQKGRWDEILDVYNIVTGEPYPSFNSDFARGKVYSLKNVLTKLRPRNNSDIIVYVSTCDPYGDKPDHWTGEEWNRFIQERGELQSKHRKLFRKFKKNYGGGDFFSRMLRHTTGLVGRFQLGVGEGGQDPHYSPDREGQRFIKAVSKRDTTKPCHTPCEYKDVCYNNIPVIGDLAKRCQDKYCITVDGWYSPCIELDVRKQERNRFRGRGGKRKSYKKKKKTQKNKKKTQKKIVRI